MRSREARRRSRRGRSQGQAYKCSFWYILLHARERGVIQKAKTDGASRSLLRQFFFSFLFPFFSFLLFSVWHFPLTSVPFSSHPFFVCFSFPFCLIRKSLKIRGKSKGIKEHWRKPKRTLTSLRLHFYTTICWFVLSLFKNFRNTTNSKSWKRLCKFMRSREARRRSHAELAPEDRFIKVASGAYCWFITVTFWFTLLHARFPFIAATDLWKMVKNVRKIKGFCGIGGWRMTGSAGTQRWTLCAFLKDSS